jgi:tetratricopeptide (TPR) repeat protein
MDSLIRKDSGNYGFWFRKGNLAESARDTQLALSSYTVAAKIYPSPEILLSLANLYAEQKNPRALLLVNEVQKLGLGRETEANCFFIAGVYNARIKNRELAVQLFDRCIANNYTYMEAYIEKGLVYFDNGNYREALKVFSFASSVNNLYADAYYYMARCYEMMNIKDSAELRFKQSLTLDKNLKEAHNGLKRLGAE